MGTDAKIPATIGLVIALLVTVAAVPAAADLLPPHCIGRDQHAPSTGDGPQAGDDEAGDGGPLLVSGPCYTGKLTPYPFEMDEDDADDADDFVLVPPGGLWIIEAFALEGCGDVTIELHVNGATASDRICADGDDTAWWGILVQSQVTITFDDGDLTYAFHHPAPGI